MTSPMFKGIDNSPQIPKAATKWARGISGIDDMIISMLREYEGDRVPANPLLEWMEVGDFTCMRIHLVDAEAADDDGMTPVLAVALLLGDVFTTDDAYINIIVQSLRFSMHMADGRVPETVLTDW